MTQKPSLRPSARDPREWWSTPLGVAARRHLITWGAVHRERLVTGDPAALPAHAGIAGGGRGAFDLPDTALLYAEVESWLGSHCVERDRQLVDWIYVRGLEDRSRVQYLFRDGTRSDVLGEEEAAKNPPPSANVLQEFRTTWREVRYDLRRFPCAETEAYCRVWGLDKAITLERRHAAIGRALAASLGLMAVVNAPDPSFEHEN